MAADLSVEKDALYDGYLLSENGCLYAVEGGILRDNDGIFLGQKIERACVLNYKISAPSLC